MSKQETVSLSAETKAPPKQATSNYQSIGPSAELVGGGTVFLSRNRKAVAKWQPGESRPAVFVTAEVGTMQQSVPYRAVGTALVHEIIPVAQVVDLYRDNGLFDALLASLVSEKYRDDFGLALLGNDDAGDYIANLYAPVEEYADPDPDPTPDPDAEVKPEDLALS